MTTLKYILDMVTVCPKALNGFNHKEQCLNSSQWCKSPMWSGPPPLPLKKRCSFHYRGLECKSRKSRNTWSNRQIWPWSTDWSRAKDNRVFPREYTGHSKHPLPTTQEKTLHMDITRWSIPKSDIIFFAAKDGETLYSLQKHDRELTVAQIMNSLLPNSDWNWRK